MTTRFIEERIPAPSGAREILKVNVFERMVGANCQLMPLFPYYDVGSIVPCGAIFNGRPGAEFGHFFHYNTVAEVAVVFGSNNAMLATGQAFASQPLHGVNSFLREPENPEAFMIATITQLQADGGEQNEAVIFRCRSCHGDLLRHDYSATPEGAPGFDPATLGNAPGDMMYGFPTLSCSIEATDAIVDEKTRTCSKCGEVAPRFPIEAWGWDRWVHQLDTANRARRALDAHAARLASEPAAP